MNWRPAWVCRASFRTTRVIQRNLVSKRKMMRKRKRKREGGRDGRTEGQRDGGREGKECVWTLVQGSQTL